MSPTPATNTAPIGRNYVEGQSRSMVTWTPSRIRSAEALARNGNLWLAAKLCEDLLTDDRVSGVLSTRVEGLLGLALEFDAGIGRLRKRALRAIEAEEDWWAMFPEDQLGQLLTWGILLGVGLGELIWSYRPNGRVICRLKVWNPESLRFDWPTRKWFLTIEGGSEIEIVRGDPKWILYTPGGDDRPWMHGAWRVIGRWWLLKGLARDDLARHSEVHGSPMKVGIGAQNAEQDDIKRLANDLANAGSETSIGLPFGWEAKLLEATSRSWEMFPAQVKLGNDGITIALAGQNLTTEVSGGSLAAAQVHKEIRGDKIRFDDETLSTTVHDQALEWWAEFNFGARALAPWPLHDTEPPEDVGAKADSIGKLGTAAGKINDELSKIGATDADGNPVCVDLVKLLEDNGVPLTKRAAAPASESTAPRRIPPIPALPQSP